MSETDRYPYWFACRRPHAAGTSSPRCLATQRREHEAVELVAAQQREWLVLLERLAREAEELGELDPGTDPAQLAFELQALLVAANTSFILQGDAGVFEQARAAIRERLGAR